MAIDLTNEQHEVLRGLASRERETIALAKKRGAAATFEQLADVGLVKRDVFVPVRTERPIDVYNITLEGIDWLKAQTITVLEIHIEGLLNPYILSGGKALADDIQYDFLKEELEMALEDGTERPIFTVKIRQMNEYEFETLDDWEPVVV